MQKKTKEKNQELLAAQVEKIEIDPNTHHSIIREKLIEHLFIADILKHAWLTKGYDSYEISRPEVDFGGYDLIIEKSNKIRHIQLKTRVQGATTGSYNIAVALTKKPLGCVIVIEFDEKLNLIYHFFGNSIGHLKLDGHSSVKPDKMKKVNFNPKRFKKASLEELLDVHLFPVDIVA